MLKSVCRFLQGRLKKITSFWKVFVDKSIEYEKNIAHQFSGFRYDCGSKLGFLEAQIASAFMDNDMKKDIIDIFDKIKKQHGVKSWK